jgi:hypothetical protein
MKTVEIICRTGTKIKAMDITMRMGTITQLTPINKNTRQWLNIQQILPIKSQAIKTTTTVITILIISQLTKQTKASMGHSRNKSRDSFMTRK